MALWCANPLDRIAEVIKRFGCIACRIFDRQTRHPDLDRETNALRDARRIMGEAAFEVGIHRQIGCASLGFSERRLAEAASRMETLACAVRLEPAKEGGYVVTCRDLPEVIAQGDEFEEALAQASDAMDEAFAARIDDGEEFLQASAPRKENMLLLRART